jgi:hypothetical protein
VDAQGLKWSPDGRWLAVWDSASSGYKVFIYTPDGHLYRTYTGTENGFNGLGVKIIEWSPKGSTWQSVDMTIESPCLALPLLVSP